MGRRPPTACDSGDGRPRTHAIGEDDPMLAAYLREWRELAMTVNGVRMWVCVRGACQYVMSFNPQRNEWGASAKVVDERLDPQRPRIDLGWHFKSREEAEQACEQHQQQTRM